jgi:hypothetical protein
MPRFRVIVTKINENVSPPQTLTLTTIEDASSAVVLTAKWTLALGPSETGRTKTVRVEPVDDNTPITHVQTRG